MNELARAHTCLQLVAAALLALTACSQSSAATTTNPAQDPSPIARYYLVGPDGARATDPQQPALLPGFGVAVIEEIMLGAERMGRTRGGRLLRMRDLQLASASSFHGSTLRDGRLDFGWVGPERAYVWSEPAAHGKPKALREAHALVRLRSAASPPDWIAVEGGFMQRRALHVPTPAPRPYPASADAPWLDVELASQTLVAYEGERAVFATLVSTGIGAQGSAFATPLGVHRITSKLRAATMDNLEHTGVVRYAYEDVPYTQYIGRVALHGTFWHDRFGVPVSHGCINVSVPDAQRLFAFTAPELPPGELEIATRPEQASVIRVR